MKITLPSANTDEADQNTDEFLTNALSTTTMENAAREPSLEQVNVLLRSATPSLNNGQSSFKSSKSALAAHQQQLESLGKQLHQSKFLAA